MLNQYLTQTQQLLQNPQASTALYSTALLTGYINTARTQLAGESECIRVPATLSTVAAQQVYPFSSIDTSAVQGIAGVYNIKQITVAVGEGAKFVHFRNFQWFNYFLLSKVVPATTIPSTWTQYAQGVNGSLYLYPIPDNTYTLNIDAVCMPIPLVTDSTVEAIPYPWTDCVPFFAAFYAYMSAQRQDDADKMYSRYSLFAQRARSMSNSAVLTKGYPQAVDPTLPNKLGSQPATRGRGGR